MLGPIKDFVKACEKRGVPLDQHANIADGLISYSAPVGYKLIFYRGVFDNDTPILVDHVIINEEDEEGWINDDYMFDLYLDDVDVELIKYEVIA